MQHIFPQFSHVLFSLCGVEVEPGRLEKEAYFASALLHWAYTYFAEESTLINLPKIIFISILLFLKINSKTTSFSGRGDKAELVPRNSQTISLSLAL